MRDRRTVLMELSALAAAAGLGLPVSSAHAQAPFLSRSVRIVVPYPAGGGTDILGRLIADHNCHAQWNHSVVVENIGGAAGNIGAANVARSSLMATPLMVAAPGPISTNAFLYKDMPYGPRPS